MIGKYPHTAAIREVRRARAEIVQAQSKNLSPEERLKRLNESGFRASKERAKLARKIFERDEKAQALAQTCKPPKAEKMNKKKLRFMHNIQHGALTNVCTDVAMNTDVAGGPTKKVK